jgi:peptidyl-tRNA hydrolase, PTH1 family
MKAIVGLGNPGVLYARSRHNIGAVVIKALGKRYHCSLRRNTRIFALSGILDIEGQQVVVAAPLTYMNRSGISVGALAAAYSLDIADLLVVCDDLDLELVFLPS